MSHKTLTVRLPAEHVEAFNKFRKQVGYRSDNDAAVKLIVHALSGGADCISLPQGVIKVQQTDALARMEERLGILENQVAQLRAGDRVFAHSERGMSKTEAARASGLPPAAPPAQPASPVYADGNRPLPPPPKAELTEKQRKAKEGMRALMVSDLASLRPEDWETLHAIEDELGIPRTPRPAPPAKEELGL